MTGPFGQKMIEDLIVRAEGGVTARLLVQAGPQRISVGFARQELLEAMEGSFVLADRGDASARLTIVTQRDFDMTDILGSRPERYAHAVGDSGYALWVGGPPDLLYLADRRSRSGLVWSSADLPPSWELSRPGGACLFALGLWRGWLAIHAAAIGSLGRHVLIAGESGAGKSTIALACALAGWSLAGDDTVAVSCEAPPRVWPLYASARLRSDVEGMFAGSAIASAPRSTDSGETRLELQLKQLLPDLVLAGGPLCAVVLLRRRGAAGPSIARAARGDALRELISSNVRIHPGWRRQVTAALLTIIGQLPMFWFDPGDGIAATPDFLARWLEALEARA
jgi:hypothetical protein